MAKATKRINHDEIVPLFGSRLRESRLTRGMTQADLAQRAGVSTAYVGRLERGRAAPGIDLVARLARALGTGAADLLPMSVTPDAAGTLRQQARRLFDALMRTEDQVTLSLVTQLLARILETTP